MNSWAPLQQLSINFEDNCDIVKKDHMKQLVSFLFHDQIFFPWNDIFCTPNSWPSWSVAVFGNSLPSKFGIGPCESTRLKAASMKAWCCSSAEPWATTSWKKTVTSKTTVNYNNLLLNYSSESPSKQKALVSSCCGVFRKILDTRSLLLFIGIWWQVLAMSTLGKPAGFFYGFRRWFTVGYRKWICFPGYFHFEKLIMRKILLFFLQLTNMWTYTVNISFRTLLEGKKLVEFVAP